MTLELIASLESVASGPLNPALCTFHFTGVAALTDAELAARVIGYLAVCEGVMGEGGVVLTGLQMVSPVPGPALDVPFPVTAYAALRTDLTGWDTGLIAMSAYGVSLNGSGNTSSGRGDSMCNSLRASSGGRHGQGRVFLPFLSKGAIDGSGLIATSVVSRLQAAYNVLMLGQEATEISVTLVSPEPVVFQRPTGPGRAIVQGSIARIPSRLRSRTK